MMQSLWVENAIFFAMATLFLAIVAWAWRKLEAYKLPSPLPDWFSLWFGTVQLLGIVPPFGALIYWGVWQHNSVVLAIFLSYFLMLGLQILSEFLTLRQFQTVVWVMVPYLYLPYRIWQLYEGTILIQRSNVSTNTDLSWVQILLLGEIALWIGNYLLDLAQLPRLLRWQLRDPDE